MAKALQKALKLTNYKNKNKGQIECKSKRLYKVGELLMYLIRNQLMITNLSAIAKYKQVKIRIINNIYHDFQINIKQMR